MRSTCYGQQTQLVGHNITNKFLSAWCSEIVHKIWIQVSTGEDLTLWTCVVSRLYVSKGVEAPGLKVYLSLRIESEIKIRRCDLERFTIERSLAKLLRLLRTQHFRDIATCDTGKYVGLDRPELHDTVTCNSANINLRRALFTLSCHITHHLENAR